MTVEKKGGELPWDGEMGEPLADEMVDEAATAEARESQQGADEAGVSEERGYRCTPEVAAKRIPCCHSKYTHSILASCSCRTSLTY